MVGVRNYEVGHREMLVAYHLPLHLPLRWGSQLGIRAKVVIVWSPFGASILCSFLEPTISSLTIWIPARETTVLCGYNSKK